MTAAEPGVIGFTVALGAQRAQLRFDRDTVRDTGEYTGVIKPEISATYVNDVEVDGAPTLAPSRLQCLPLMLASVPTLRQQQIAEIGIA
jgi:hypothetical protein